MSKTADSLLRNLTCGELLSGEFSFMTSMLSILQTTHLYALTVNSMWSLYVGRPWGINIRDISISRPSQSLDKVRNKSWIPYSGESKFGTLPIDAKGYYNPIEACADSNVSLCAMMRRLSRTLSVNSRSLLTDLATNLNPGTPVGMSQTKT